MTPGEDKFTVKETLIAFRDDVTKRLDNIEKSLADTAKAERVEGVVARLEKLELADASESKPREVRRVIRDVAITAVTSAVVAGIVLSATGGKIG